MVRTVLDKFKNIKSLEYLLFVDGNLPPSLQQTDSEWGRKRVEMVLTVAVGVFDEEAARPGQWPVMQPWQRTANVSFEETEHSKPQRSRKQVI